MQEPRLYQDNQSTMTIVLEKPEKILRTKHLTARRVVLYEAIVIIKEAILFYKIHQGGADRPLHEAVGRSRVPVAYECCDGLDDSGSSSKANTS